MEEKNFILVQNNEFIFENPSEHRFRFLLFKSSKNVDILVLIYSTPITNMYNNSITYITLYNLKTKEKIKEYKSQSVRNLQHYCFNNQDLLININDRNAIIIYDIEKDKYIKIIDEPAENYYEDFFGRDMIFEMNYCPLFIQDGKINLITSCINDNFISLWDYDSCKLIKKVQNFELTFCTKVYTENNINYLIVTNKNFASYTLPDFKLFKKYYEFQEFERRKFSIEKINNIPLLFVFDNNLLKIFEFYSGNLFKTVEFNLSLNMSNIILWDNEHIIICDDDWVWEKSGNSYIYNLKTNTISNTSYNGYNFIKYKFDNKKYLYYNDNQQCILSLKEGKNINKNENQKHLENFEDKLKKEKDKKCTCNFPFLLIMGIILIIGIIRYCIIINNNNYRYNNYRYNNYNN